MNPDLLTIVQLVVTHGVVLGIAIVTLATMIGLCVSERR